MSSNSEQDAESFFSKFLGMKKTRVFEVEADLTEKFFGVYKKQKIIRFENSHIAVEVFINEEQTKHTDIFTHVCIEVEKRDQLLQKAEDMKFPVIKVPRKEGDSYYLFIKDDYGNLYEIKEL